MAEGPNFLPRPVRSECLFGAWINLLIQQHGENAPIFAAMQADKCLEGGDLDGKAVWMGVIGAIKELLDQNPPNDGKSIH